MISNIVVVNPKFIYKNFKGSVTEYNPKGVRNFSFILEKDLADTLKNDGWYVRYLKNRKEGTVEPYLKVIINYKYFNKPEIICSSPEGKFILDEDQIDILDKIEINKSRLLVRSYVYKNDGYENVIAYLKSLEILDLIASNAFNLYPAVKKEENTVVDEKDILNDPVEEDGKNGNVDNESNINGVISIS